MAPLPKRRHSTRRGGKRQAAIKLNLDNLIRCTNCKQWRLPHRVCTACGYYNGQKVIKVRSDKSKAKSKK